MSTSPHVASNLPAPIWEGLDFTDLAARTARLRGAAPSVGEAASIWRTACQAVAENSRLGGDGAEIKRKVCAWLLRYAPGLATSEKALTRNFYRKLDRFATTGAVMDRRAEAAKMRRAPKLTRADRDLLIQSAVMDHWGSIAAAWRELYPKLNKDIRARYSRFGDGNTRKSYVPRRIAEQLRAEVDWLHAEHIGTSRADLSSPAINRDWSDVCAGDVFSTDDKTLDIYVASRERPINGGWEVFRQQYFPFVDERSKVILSHLLLNSPTFNGLDLRTGFIRLFLDIGIPRRMMRLENGIFRSSRFLGGRELSAVGGLLELETDFSSSTWAERLGIRISHTRPRNPRGKIVENILGLITRKLPRERMFVGRNEQELKVERVQKAIADVRTGRKSPEEAGMLYEDEWEQRLTEIEDEYNHEAQESKVIGGDRIVAMSPLEAWDKFQSKDGIVRLPTNLRYLLGHREEGVIVKKEGIRLKLPGKQIRLYWSDEVFTQGLLGQMVTTWFDPTRPEALSLEDSQGRFFTLPEQSDTAPAIATREQLLSASVIQRGERKLRRDRYQNLIQGHQPPARPLGAVDPLTAAKGIEFERQRTELSAESRAAQRRQSSRQRTETLNVDIVRNALADV